MLETVREEDISRTKELINEGFCDCVLKEGTANLYIEARAVCKDEEALVVIENELTISLESRKTGEYCTRKKKRKLKCQRHRIRKQWTRIC